MFPTSCVEQLHLPCIAKCTRLRRYLNLCTCYALLSSHALINIWSHGRLWQGNWWFCDSFWEYMGGHFSKKRIGCLILYRSHFDGCCCTVLLRWLFCFRRHMVDWFGTVRPVWLMLYKYRFVDCVVQNPLYNCVSTRITWVIAFGTVRPGWSFLYRSHVGDCFCTEPLV